MTLKTRTVVFHCRLQLHVAQVHRWSNLEECLLLERSMIIDQGTGLTPLCWATRNGKDKHVTVGEGPIQNNYFRFVWLANPNG